jgi:hypothetical protein
VAYPVLAVPNAARVPANSDGFVASGVNPVHDPNPPPVPCSIDTDRYDDNAFVVAVFVAYSFTADGNDPLEVTAMQFAPVSPGFSPVTVNKAAFASSSVNATDPADQLLASLDVVAENAAYDAFDTATPDTANAAGMANQAVSLAVRGVTRGKEKRIILILTLGCDERAG